MSKLKAKNIFCLMGIIMGLLFSSGQIENPDTHLRLTQTRLFLETGTWGLPDNVGEDKHGNIAINDNGKRHMVYNPGQSLVFIPIYTLTKSIFSNAAETYYSAAFLISFLNFFIHALSGYFLYLIAFNLSQSEKKAYFTSLIFCFTSYSFTFAQSTYEHHYEMLFILIAFYLAISSKTKIKMFQIGLILSVGLLFRTTTILALPCIVILLPHKKQIIFILAGIMPGIIFVMLYNYFRFQHPLESGYNLAWSLAHGTNFQFWSFQNFLPNLFGLIISPVKGLFIFSPTLILAIAFYKRFVIKHRLIAISILLYCSFNLVLFSLNFAWHGSIWSFGPRYILTIVPLLYLPLIMVENHSRHIKFIIMTIIGPILLMSVNYKRELLTQYMNDNIKNEDKYIWEIKNTPYLTQFRQLQIIIPKNFNHNLQDLYPNEPWIKEKRKGNGHDMLNLSIEKNSINFWWARVCNTSMISD
jgi:hypothetical protein